MIRVHKTPTAPPALQRSHVEMQKYVQQAVRAGALVVLCTKGTNTAKTKSVPKGSVKIVINDEQYKPPLNRWSYTLIACLLPQLCVASTLHIDPPCS